jgi:hypothetical protein
MNARLIASRIASILYPNHYTVKRLTAGNFRRRRARQQVDAKYVALLERLRHDLGLDEQRRHVEDLVAHLDLRIDAVMRELARRDPAMQWEPRSLPHEEEQQ